MIINARVLALAALAAGVSTGCIAGWGQNLLISPTAAQGSDQPPRSSASTPTSTLQRTPRATAPRMLPPGKPISIDDLLTGINLSNEQKPRIEQVRKDTRDRMDLVIHDKNENADQKQAMLEGLRRLELRAVYLLLTPDQRIEVKNKIAVQRAAEQQPQRSPQESQPK